MTREELAELLLAEIERQLSTGAGCALGPMLPPLDSDEFEPIPHTIRLDGGIDCLKLADAVLAVVERRRAA